MEAVEMPVSAAPERRTPDEASAGMSPATERRRLSSYIWIAAAMNVTMVTGFWFTYFDPLLRGVYPPASPLLHVHGWSFFAWYPLLIVQASLVRVRRVSVHRALGWVGAGLAVLMVGIGLIVTTVRIELTRAAGGDPFWDFMGLPIFSVWVLFTIFVSAAIFRRRRVAEHKRFIVLASAVALSAATTRIAMRIFGFEPWTVILGMLAPLGFVLAGMLDDVRTRRRIHPVYAWGFVTIFVIIGGACLLVGSPAANAATAGVAVLGRLLRPLY